ncbi:calcium-binding protein, partial [Thermomonas alba]|uniref:calcium-binding protein n=1 Tax=Thermomonas alba TaxID=2888525 RepID=UPI0023D92899
GNDTIIGSSNDELYGGEGDDTLKVDAYAQNAVFVGGKGNDVLIGGYYSDRYVFNLGDGQDTIQEINGGYTNTDVLAFGEGIDADRLWLERTGNDLLITVLGTEDSVLIKGWYSSSSYQVEQIVLDDGRMLTVSETNALVSAMAAFTKPSTGESSIPEAYRSELMPQIVANW